MGNPMFRIIESIEKKLGGLSWLLIVFGSFFLVLVMFINIINIAGRYLFRMPFKSTYELTGFFIIVVLCLGWPYTTYIKGHVSVDVLLIRLPRTIQNMLNIINYLIGLVFFSAMTAGAFKTGIQYHNLGQCSDLLRIPYLPLAWLMALGAFLVSVVILLQFFHELNRIHKEPD